MAELERSLAGRLKHLPDADRKALDTMVDAAVNKLLHTPTRRIKAMAGDPRADELVRAVHHLFDLADALQDVEPSSGAQRTGEAEPATEAEVNLVPSGARETLGQ